MASIMITDTNIKLIDAIKAVYSSDTYKQLEQEDSKKWHLGPVDLYNDISEETFK